MQAVFQRIFAARAIADDGDGTGIFKPLLMAGRNRSLSSTSKTCSVAFIH